VNSKPEPDYFVHESSYVDDGAEIGTGTKIWHFSHVMPGAVIGERCNLGQNVVVMPGTRLGNNVKVQNNVSIYEGVVLEDDVFCGITRGEFSFICAGAVVRSDVPPFALMVGVPARRVGWMCQCGVRLQLREGRATCLACGATYRETEAALRQIDPPRPLV
jgi:UDP-2-acetamido-3-amino-2,3-dideoxy-glucuronate N-acetyltransferase